MNPVRGEAQPSDSTCSHWVSNLMMASQGGEIDREGEGEEMGDGEREGGGNMDEGG